MIEYKFKTSGKTRSEHDLLGDKEVPAEALFGVQTLRCIENFDISRNLLGDHPQFVKAFGIVKMGAILANHELGLVSDQIKADFAGVSAQEARGVVIAYEPIWAIGTGRTATAEQAQEVCSFIREYLAENVYDWETSKAMSILYGGSMNAKNAEELLGQLDIDGGLIGGASLKPADFASIVKAGNEDE